MVGSEETILSSTGLSLETQLTVPLSIGGMGTDLTGRLERAFDLVTIYKTNVAQNPSTYCLDFRSKGGEGLQNKTYAHILTFMID